MLFMNPEHIQLLDALSQGTVILSAGRILFANRCFAEICRADRETLAGKSFSDFVIPEHRARVDAYLGSVAQESVAARQTVKFTLPDTDGIEFFVEMQAGIFPHGGGSALLCSLKDITQKTKASQKLKRILDSIPEVIMAFDSQHSRIEAANSATEGIFGLPAEQFVGNIFHPIDLVLPEDSAKVQTFYAGLVDKEIDRIEYRIVHANGDIRWVRDEGEVIYREQGLGRIQQVYHFIKDVTDRKNDEEKLRVSEQKYRSIFQYSTDPIFVAMPDGSFADINQAAIALFGYENREHALTGNVVRHFTEETERKAIMTALNRTGTVTDHPARLRTLSGEVVDVVITAGCRNNRHSGLLESYQAILHDMRPVIERTELETYRRTMGGLSDRLNNIAQVQAMQYGLMSDYIEALKSATDGPRKEELLFLLLEEVSDLKKSLEDLRVLGEKIRKIYHAPEPPVPVPDGTGGILFELK
ncbi:MAG: PAS domain-containing protein [Desulfomicrobium sp.]|nr:PAS domain-containing protein [Desulfomicrobium sp.]